MQFLFVCVSTSHTFNFLSCAACLVQFILHFVTFFFVLTRYACHDRLYHICEYIDFFFIGGILITQSFCMFQTHLLIPVFFFFLFSSIYLYRYLLLQSVDFVLLVRFLQGFDPQVDSLVNERC